LWGEVIAAMSWNPGKLPITPEEFEAIDEEQREPMGLGTETHHARSLRLDPRRPGDERTQSALHDERSLQADGLAEG
jgi:hypothetical protein